MNEVHQIAKIDQIYKGIYENISKMIWEKIEIHGTSSSYQFEIKIEQNVYEKIRNKLWSLRRYININHLNNFGLCLEECSIEKFYDQTGRSITFRIQEHKFELPEIKKKIDELKEMIEQIYYAPGMPGYALAKDDFENKM